MDTGSENSEGSGDEEADADNGESAPENGEETPAGSGDEDGSDEEDGSEEEDGSDADADAAGDPFDDIEDIEDPTGLVPHSEHVCPASQPSGCRNPIFLKHGVCRRSLELVVAHGPCVGMWELRGVRASARQS
jgi:hypothetical protein